MNVAWRVAVGAVVIAVALPLSADDPVTDADVRRAVSRSIAYIEDEGVAWMRQRACITCHQVPSMVWALSLAQQRSIDVDPARLATWTEWAAANVRKKAVYFRLATDSLERLRAADIPQDVAQRVEPLKDKNFVFDDEFRAALAEKLGDAGAPHDETIRTTAMRTGQGGTGGGENNQYTAALLAGIPDAIGDAEACRAELVAGLVKTQRKDGSWPAAGQFLGQQRSKGESVEVATMWTVYALGQVRNLSSAGAAALEHARSWLANSQPGTSTESLLLHALLADQANDTARRDELLERLGKLQHDDGGWGWLVERAESDPFTTGLVLYGLGRLGYAGRDACAPNARRYLLKIQHKDGTWPIPMKRISATKKTDTAQGDEVYRYWSTCWAVIGLLQTMPE